MPLSWLTSLAWFLAFLKLKTAKARLYSRDPVDFSTPGRRIHGQKPSRTCRARPPIGPNLRRRMADT
jgi:hypothetical protein